MFQIIELVPSSVPLSPHAESAMPLAVPKWTEPVNACRLINKLPLELLTFDLVSSRPSLVLAKHAVVGVAWHRPLPYRGPLLVRAWFLGPSKDAGSMWQVRSKFMAWCRATVTGEFLDLLHPPEGTILRNFGPFDIEVCVRVMNSSPV